MLTSYFTLRALAEEWDRRYAGARVTDVYSQRKGELVVVLSREEETASIHFSLSGPLRYMMAVDGSARARRNVVSLLDSAVSRRVLGMSVARLDRLVFFDLEGGMRLQAMLFGPRPNVYLVSAEGSIVHAFKGEDELAGSVPPEPRAAHIPADLDAFVQAWPTGRKSVAAAVSAAVPPFDAVLAEETAVRAGLDPNGPPDLPPAAVGPLFDAAKKLLDELDVPSPRLYEKEGHGPTFSLVELSSRSGFEERRFESVSEAVTAGVRRLLARQEFESAYEPLKRALDAALARVERRIDAMEAEIDSPSRSEQYEHWGHLLMTALSDIRPGQTTANVPDVFSTGEPVSIPLDPALSPVENAQEYYARSRRGRDARQVAERRLSDSSAEATRLSAMLENLRSCRTRRDVDGFRREYAGALDVYLSGPGGRGGGGVPFRRILVDGDLEVWVGRNAAQNDLLTLHHAQKHDLWFHARGASGSHVVLRLPGRKVQPTRKAIEQAAGIAAFFSEARTSGLVPVQMTERKYVRKAKGAGPGAVVVEREEVLLVEPGLP